MGHWLVLLHLCFDCLHLKTVFTVLYEKALKFVRYLTGCYPMPTPEISRNGSSLAVSVIEMYTFQPFTASKCSRQSTSQKGLYFSRD